MAEPNRPRESRDVRLPAGHSLRYYEWGGNGPNLVLLHGSSGYGLMWEWTANYLGDRFHVFAPDQRGHGDSDKPDGDYSAEEYAEDLHQFIQTLGIGKAVVGGHSLGGRVSQVFAATHPDECQGIVLVGGIHLSNFYHDRAKMEAVLNSACKMLSSPTEFASREEALTFLRGARRHDTEESHNHRIDHNMDRAGDSYRFKYDKVRAAQGLSHMADNLRKYAPLINCPVALFRSSTGSELKTLEEAQSFAKIWKDTTVRDVEGDYLLHVTGPSGLAAAITEFADAKVTA